MFIRNVTTIETNSTLSVLAVYLFGDEKFSGSITTVWHKGGLREPQLPELCNEDRRKLLAEPMKKYLPENFSGNAIWRLNGGLLSGKPRLIPANK